MEEILKIKSISELHRVLGLSKPAHNLLSIIPASELFIPKGMSGVKVIQDYYMISLKDKSCGMEYGRNSFDFDEGVMAFSAPGQVYRNMSEVNKGDIKGYMLYFHPDFIRGTKLSEDIISYSYFNYEVSEALHLSTDEENYVLKCISSLQSELNKSLNDFNQTSIIRELEKLLRLSNFFYERQFRTRSEKNQDILSQFEKLLKQFFASGKQIEKGIPPIDYFSNKVSLSQNYFSDLIKRETGKSPKDHIHNIIVEQAKNLLTGSDYKVNQIAYQLGFDYPHYFNRLFKSKTGLTPLQYRNQK